MYLVVTLLTAVPVIALLFYYVVTRKYNYWLRKKVPHHKPTFLFGNYRSTILLQKSIADVVDDLCKDFSNEPLFGAYYGTEPALIVKDPELLKTILTKDFFYFNGREITPYIGRELATKGLFFNYGDEWKMIRQNLSPLFSSGKMKNMFVLIEKCSKIFESLLDKEYDKSKMFEARSLMARFTMDCIGNCALGVETNVMGDTPDNIFTAIGNGIFEISNYRGLKLIFRSLWPSIFYGLGFNLFPNYLNEFFKTLIVNVSNERSKNTHTYHNFVDLLSTLKNKQPVSEDSLNNMVTGKADKVNLEMNEEMLVAQSFGIFGAGYETSATTLSHTLFELAKRPECQDHITAEVDNYLKKHNYKLGYECTSISELPYTNACFSETLRLYPVLGVLTREVISDYEFPNGLRVDKGVRIHIPVHHIHTNPDYFPEPEKYRPERFLGDEINNIQPYTDLPFGEGPRICIGMRFAKMQMNAGLVTIFKKYRVKLASDMPSKLHLEPRGIITNTKGQVRLEFVPRDDVSNPRFV